MSILKPSCRSSSKEVKARPACKQIDTENLSKKALDKIAKDQIKTLVALSKLESLKDHI